MRFSAFQAVYGMRGAYAHGVEYGDDRDAYVAEYGEPHPRYTHGGEYEDDDFDDE